MAWAIVGNMLSIDGSVNFKGTRVRATPLENGATMVLAEVLPEKYRELGRKATELAWGGGSGCPEGTRDVVRVTWAQRG